MVRVSGLGFIRFSGIWFRGGGVWFRGGLGVGVSGSGVIYSLVVRVCTDAARGVPSFSAPAFSTADTRDVAILSAMGFGVVSPPSIVD